MADTLGGAVAVEGGTTVTGVAGTLKLPSRLSCNDGGGSIDVGALSSTPIVAR